MNTKSILTLLAFALSILWLAPSAAIAAPARTAEHRLVGIWQDDMDPDSIIQFYPNHTLRIYLTPSEGKARNAHWIDGTWTLSRGRHLTMKLKMPQPGSKAKIRKFTIEFTRTGFTLGENGKVIARQHRIIEQTLRQHLW